MAGIEETRKERSGDVEEDGGLPRVAKPHGLLHRVHSRRFFHLDRLDPSDDLAFFVERYWTVRWNLPQDEVYTSETLPHPNVKLVFDGGKTAIFGVITKPFSYTLRGAGVVFGVTFRPGAFYPFVHRPLSALTDETIGVRDVFPTYDERIECDVLAARDSVGMVHMVEAFLRPVLPERDDRITEINAIIDRVARDRSITRVREVAEYCSMSERTLQHLFHTYVGVGLKWIINRYRLMEAVERLDAAPRTDRAALAADLGYADQAHFIRDFSAHIGVSPGEYLMRFSRRTDRPDAPPPL